MTGRGIFLVAGAAWLWSLGGLIVRSLDATDSWTIVVWRSASAAAFLLLLLLWREGPAGLAALRCMIWPGDRAALGVAACFAISSIAFVVAVGLTTIADVLLIFSSTPLIAALLAWAALGERISARTALAVAATMIVCIAMPIERIASSRCSCSLPSWKGPIQSTSILATWAGAFCQ